MSIYRLYAPCAALLLVTAALLFTGSDADAYVSIRVPSGSAGQGLAVRWNLNNPSGRPNISNRRILYEIGDAGTADSPTFINPGNEFDAIQRSFANWRNVHESEIDFEFAGSTTNAVTDGTDQRNVVRFVNSGLSAGILGVTITTFTTTTAEIIDSDMELNDQHFTWDVLGDNTQGIIGRAMIENVVTHEIGHMLGLDHPQLAHTAMYDTSAAGMINQTVLKADDRALLMRDHPNPDVPAPNLGTVQGSVTTGGSTARFGVEVLLIDAATGDPVIGSLSEGSAGPFTPGSFEIVNVPPGNYYALAVPVTTSDLGSYYATAFTNFFPILYGVDVDSVGVPTLIGVGAGETVSGININLPAAAQNPFEPDGSHTEATPIATGQAAVSRISPASDQDWYSFTTTTANQTATVRVIAHSISSSLNPELTMYAANGSTVLVSPIVGHANYQESAANINVFAFGLDGPNLDARITRTLATAGTYFFRVTSRGGASSGRYVVTLELSGADTDADRVASIVEAPVGVATGSGNFTVSVTPRNRHGRDLLAPNTFTVQLLDVTSATPVVLDTINNGTAPFDFSVAALGSSQTRRYSASIDGVPIAHSVPVSHYGALSTGNSRIVRLVRTLNANGVDRIPVRIEIRDGGNNLLPDPSVAVTVSTSAGTLDNGSATGATDVAAVFNPDLGVWEIELVAPNSTGTATVTAFANTQQIDTTSITILPRATGTGSGGGGSSKKKDSSGGGCALKGGGGAAVLALILAAAAASRRRNLARAAHVR